MDYSKVAPPSQSPADHNTAFADALARARQIAAKIGGEDSASLKRPYDGIPESQPDAKKMAAVNDPIGAQLKLLADQQRVQAVQAATNAAAQINAKLGISGGSGGQPTEFGEWQDNGVQGMPEYGDWQSNGVQPGMPQAAPMANSIPGMGGMVTTENYQVPDRMVGLVIGKGGENIAMIQSETGVKVQFAQDSGGLPDRPCTLTGSQEGIAKAKELIQMSLSSSKAKELVQRIISKGQGLPENNMHDGVTMEEVMIPGNKVGLVIGKGGENIKLLQEKAQVKMVMIQDNNMPTNVDKPLRITGEPSRVAQAKEMVFDLLAEKEAQAANFGGGGGNEYGGNFFGGGGNKQEVTVPRSLVGVIIGKGGEMIKKITQDTGAKIQLKPDDGQGPERVCMVMGPPDRVEAAVEFINSLLDSANNGGMGRGRGRGRGDMGRGDENRPGGGGNGYGGKDETTYIVPADKTGLVIGKGGETVKEINRVTGAWVELSRDRPPNPHDRVFKISGSPDQISQAIRMVCEKAGLPPPRESRGPGGPPQGFGAGGGGGGYNQQHSPQPMGGPQQGGAPQGWGNAYNAGGGGGAGAAPAANQWNQPQENQPKPPEQNAAAWAAYYQNYYQQTGQQPAQPQPQQAPQQPQAQPQQPQQAQPPQQAYGQQAQPQAAAINPATGQPDYSAQWAEYYRQQGMHYHAQAILQQAAAAAGQPQQQQAMHPGQQ